MPFLDSYKLYLNNAGVNARQSIINRSKKEWVSLMVNSPSYYEVTLNDSVEPVGVLIVDDSKNKDLKVVTMPPDTVLNRGDYVNWRNSKWLTLITDYQVDIYYRGIISQCYDSLRWITKEGEIKEAFFTTYQDFYSILGVKDNKVIDIPSERRIIIIQANDDTKKIKKDQRFILDNRAWKIIGVNGIYTGIIYLTLEESLIDLAKDNVELRIANYFDYIQDEPTQPTNGIEIIISSQELNANEIKISQSKVYKATVYVDGIEDPEKKVIWSLFADNQIDSTTLATISNVNGNEITIRANSNSQYGYVQLKAQLENDDSVATWFRIKIRSLI
mgnify:CR=1 FL=1